MTNIIWSFILSGFSFTLVLGNLRGKMGELYISGKFP